MRPEFDGDMVWLAGMRKPMLAAVNGACAGIAVALAAFCDLRIGVEGAKITTATPNLGLPAEYGLSWILPRLVGVTHSADILLTGRVILAEEMADWGFFNAVVPRADFDAKVAVLRGPAGARRHPTRRRPPSASCGATCSTTTPGPRSRNPRR